MNVAKSFIEFGNLLVARRFSIAKEVASKQMSFKDGKV